MAGSNSKTAAIFTGAVGSIVAAAVVAWMGLDAAPQAGVTIDGPTLTLQETAVRLAGHVNGDFQRAYWTDELGQTAEMYGSDGVLDWYCLGPGNFTVSLIAVMKDGSQHQDTHEIQCV
jgi:hypothetical protein